MTATYTPETAAAKALRDTDGDWQAAAKLLKRRVEGNRTLRDTLLAPFLVSAVWYHIRQAAHHKRLTYPVGQKADNTAGIERVSERNWYEYPLPGGLPLGDATRDDLASAVAHHREQAESNARKAEWLERVLAAIPRTSRKTVREKLSESEIAALASAALETA